MVDSIEKELKSIKKFTIRYIKDLIKKYGKEYPRRTQIQAIEQIDIRTLAHAGGIQVRQADLSVAAGGCEMQTRGRTIRLVDPELIVDPELRDMPWPLGVFLGRFNRVTELLWLRAE